MKGKSKLKIVICLIVIVIISLVSYKPLVNYLSKQAANPEGFIGEVMTWIWAGYFKDMSEWGLTLIEIETHENILDIGFGGGSNINNMAIKNESCMIYGVDISEEAVKTATKTNQQHIDNGRVILSVGDVADLQFEDNFFDLLVAGQTHIYWEELEKGLNECYRVLTQNGTFLITCEIDKIEYHLPKYQDSDEFAKLLYEIGFSDVSVKSRGNYIAFIATK